MSTERSGVPTELVRFLSGFVGALPIHALVGAFTGFPAVVAALILAPAASTYVVFGIAGLVAIRTTASFRESADGTTIPDSEELTAEEIRLLLALVVSSTTVAVSLRTGIAGAAAYWLAIEAGFPMLGLFVAVGVPLVDEYVASTRPVLSIEYWANRGVFACHGALASFRDGDTTIDEKLTRIARRGPLL